MPFGFRSDADLVRDASPTRAIMPLLMRGRNESAVLFDMAVDAGRIHPFLDAFRQRTGKKATVLHLVVAAAGRILVERPRMNRFVAGGRLWQRRGVFVSFSAKTSKDDQGAVVALKRKIDGRATLAEIVDAVDGMVGDTRAGKQNSTDKELKLLLALPHVLLSWFVRLARQLDGFGLMPHAMIETDPLYASLFIANLGSIGMDAPFHHLYEWGNIPLFCAIGAERDDVVWKDGTPAHRRVLPMRFTFDERIEDGLYCLKAIQRLQELLEDPASAFPLP